MRFLTYFLLLAVTPFFAKPIAPLFDWIGYSLLRDMFAEIFVLIFWGIEALGLHFLEKYIAKRRKNGALNTEEEGSKKREKKAKREPVPPLPLKNVWILTGISAVCIFLASAVIGFKVKPFYDIGEKVMGYEFWCEIAVIGRNIFKCLWLVAMVGACKGMADEIVRTTCLQKGYYSSLITGGIFLLFGIFDVFTSVVKYPLGGRGVLLALVYLLFYVAFTAVYYVTKESKGKSYGLFVLIYLL